MSEAMGNDETLTRERVWNEDGSEELRVFANVDVERVGHPPTDFLDEVGRVARLGERRGTPGTQGMAGDIVVEMLAQPPYEPATRWDLS